MLNAVSTSLEKRIVIKHTPWTSIADIKMISILLGRELGAGLPGDEVAELRVLPFEFTILAGVVCDLAVLLLSSNQRMSMRRAPTLVAPGYVPT